MARASPRSTPWTRCGNITSLSLRATRSTIEKLVPAGTSRARFKVVVPPASAEDRGGTVRHAVETTLATGSARLLYASRDGELVPEPEDIHGEGVADLHKGRVWISYRSITKRDAAGLLRKRRSLLTELFTRISRRPRELYFDPATRYKRKRDGSWSEGLPLRSWEEWERSGFHAYTRETEHPLWLLQPLARLQAELGDATPEEPVRGVETRRYSLGLTADEIPALIWDELAQPHALPPQKAHRWYRPGPFPKPRSVIPALIWLDSEQRIRRMSYEARSYHPWESNGGEQSWWITTELWDFGVEIDRAPPSAPASQE